MCVFADAIRVGRAEAKFTCFSIAVAAVDAIRVGRAEAKEHGVNLLGSRLNDAIRVGRAEAKISICKADMPEPRCNPRRTC